MASPIILLGALIPWAHANAPPCQYVVVSDTVLDNNTKLTWERALSSGPVEWSQAYAHCASLALAGGGWRMPTIQELQTLVDDSKHNPAIDEAAFPNTPADYAWSSTPYAEVAGPVWRVNFYDGFVNAGGMNNAHIVRCVR